MNKGYYKTLDENFTQALNLYEAELSHDELITLLKSGNIVQKQISALRLDCVKSTQEARILISNLTGQDGKIREAVALRINEFMSDPDFIGYFSDIENYSVFIDAIIDINANICRNIISAVSNLKNNDEFCKYFCQKLTRLTFELLDKIEKFDFQEGKYKINKEVFKLYWCLETVYEFWDKLDFAELKQIILRSKDIKEYTIREKTAKILTRNFDDKELLNAKFQLQNDDNYYVRRFNIS